MNESPRNSDPAAAGSLVRDVAVIVLVGAALGVAHNSLMLASGPGKGLAWIKPERTVARLEDLVPALPSPAATPAPVVASAPETAPAGATPARDHASGEGNPKGGSVARARPGETATPPTPTASATPSIASHPASGAPATGSGPTAFAPPPPDVPAIPESGDPLESGLAVVRKLHAANAAVFVDARDAVEYAEGHIAGAINMPFDEVFRDPKRLERLEDRGLPVVTYCGGGDCDLSRSLAFTLIDAGKRRVLVFKGGLPEWQQAGLPVTKGSQP